MASGRHISPWVDTMEPIRLRPAGRRIGESGRPQVLVLGGGITGLTTGLLLQREGLRVTVVEADDLGRSVTTHSTVKVTVGQGTVYSKIEQTAGLGAAAAYAEANVAGFQHILDLVSDLHIDCMLERGEPHVIYAETRANAPQVEREAEVAAAIGLPVSRPRRVPLPFDVAAAVSFDQQAQFHPGRYLAGLAEAFVREGGTVIEGVRARGVDEDADVCHVDTTVGPLAADYIVVATHYPFLNRGGQFAWMTVSRSYGIAGALGDGVPAGMTINVESPTRSTRTATIAGDRLLIVVGEGHEVGHVSDTEERWVRLQEWARNRFGVTDFRYHWSAQENSSFDHIPFVGFIAPGSKRVLTATGFDGWGMTNGTASAMLMRDLIVGRDNPWSTTFDARRAEGTLPGKQFVSHNLDVAKRWVKDRVGPSSRVSPHELQPGEATILAVDGKDTAAYRDEEGTLHAVSAVCTHMKCNVRWNVGEKSWDCPCHGSRFDPDGTVLHGPAARPLARRDLDDG